jgi:hypothetical protein
MMLDTKFLALLVGGMWQGEGKEEMVGQWKSKQRERNIVHPGRRGKLPMRRDKSNAWGKGKQERNLRKYQKGMHEKMLFKLNVVDGRKKKKKQKQAVLRR